MDKEQNLANFVSSTGLCERGLKAVHMVDGSMEAFSEGTGGDLAQDFRTRCPSMPIGVQREYLRFLE